MKTEKILVEKMVSAVVLINTGWEILKSCAEGVKVRNSCGWLMIYKCDVFINWPASGQTSSIWNIWFRHFHRYRTVPTNKLHIYLTLCVCVCFICADGTWSAFRAPWWATSQSQSTSLASSSAAFTMLTTSLGPCTSASPISRTCPSSSPSTGPCSVVSAWFYVEKSLCWMMIFNYNLRRA